MKIRPLYLSIILLVIITLSIVFTKHYTANKANLSVDKFMPSKINQQVTLSSKTNYHNLKIITEFIENNKVQLRQISSSTILIEHLELKTDGIYSVYTQEEFYEKDNMLDITPNKNELILKTPLKVGTSWIGESGTQYTITSTDHTLETYAGNFNTIEVTSIYDGFIKNTYFAEGLGIIKITSKDTLGNLVSDLEIFSLQESKYSPKDYRFYYYDINSDKIVYDTKNVPQYEPERMSFYMINKLKNPPTGLSPTVNDSVKLNNIIAIPSKKFVAIDFSSNFINDSNIDSNTEKALIQCVVNTFGYNFEATNILITINNEPYSSKFTSMDKNEFFKVDFSKEEEIYN